MSAVAQWQTPDSHNKVQQFLGFANFYRRLIRGFSAIAAPLHAVMFPQTPFRWTPQAIGLFCLLKKRSTTDPILMVPDPSHQLVVKMDASSEGVGAPPLCIAFEKLTAVEWNYNVGNKELLAVKVAHEEWRH